MKISVGNKSDRANRGIPEVPMKKSKYRTASGMPYLFIFQVKKPRREREAANASASAHKIGRGKESSRPGKKETGNASKIKALPLTIRVYLLEFCTSKNTFYFNDQSGVGICLVYIRPVVLEAAKYTVALYFNVPMGRNQQSGTSKYSR